MLFMMAGSLTEALQTLELPKLPTPGCEGAFSPLWGLDDGGVSHRVRRVGKCERRWWAQTVKTVEAYYSQWLTASPLEKLRLKPEAPGLAEHFARVEQRGISMLLECMGEPLRQEVIASRRTTAVDILFRLFTMCQPGVGERTSLLRGITDVKVPAGMADVFNAIRIWRRSAGRSEEVNVTVDPLALAGVLAKFADSVAKLGGSQVAFRLATMRQQLDVDRAPKLDAVKDWAEYIQAELEELSKAQSVAKLAQPHRP